MGSLQCLAYEVSYSTHILQTCSSALHDLHTSRRRSGKLSAAKDAPQRQHVREWAIGKSYYQSAFLISPAYREVFCVGCQSRPEPKLSALPFLRRHEHWT